MAPVLLSTLVALVAAAVVLLLAGSVGQPTGGLRQLLADRRAGLSREPGTAGGPAASFRALRRDAHDPHDDPGEVESSVDGIFALGQFDGSAYLGADELARTLGRAAPRTRGTTSAPRS